jgi:hypothetical protein
LTLHSQANISLLSWYRPYRASGSVKLLVNKPTFMHNIVYIKSHTNFHCVVFRHPMMPSSGSSSSFFSTHPNASVSFLLRSYKRMSSALSHFEVAYMKSLFGCIKKKLH